MKNIHLIPTDKPSRLMIDTIENKFYFQPILHDKTVNVLTHNTYITNDEEIKDRNYWVTNGKEVFKPLDFPEYSLEYVNRYWEKIILTTDQDLIKDGVQAIEDEFLEWFVKNPSCERVDVNDWMSTNGTIAFGGDKRYQICNHIHNKIILPKEEHPNQIKCYCGHTTMCDCSPLDEAKKETLEEAADIERIAMDKLKNKWGHLYTFGYPQRPFPTNYENDLNNIKIGLYEGAKWQQERMEEDLQNAFITGALTDLFNTWDISKEDMAKEKFEKWFEQFKKK
jgi:hypothetical protein